MGYTHDSRTRKKGGFDYKLRLLFVMATLTGCSLPSSNLPVATPVFRAAPSKPMSAALRAYCARQVMRKADDPRAYGELGAEACSQRKLLLRRHGRVL